MSFVLALTGPGGSGKTSLATKLAKELPGWVNIDADHIKHMVPSGFTLVNLEDGTEHWKYNEWELLGDNIGMLAANFQARGYNVIINGYIVEPGWHAIKKHVTLTHKILLLPNLEVNKIRDKQRPGDEPLGEKDVKRHHNYFSSDKLFNDFTKIDSSDQSIDETALEIKHILYSD